MILKFDLQKAMQAAAIVLDCENGKMSYFRLLKLLYFADRESLKETGSPITTAHAAALPHGPVPSEICNLIRGERLDASEWSKVIRTHGYSAILVSDPGRGRLSAYEIEKLRSLVQKYESFTDPDLEDLSHTFSEYIKNDPRHGPKGSLPIQIEDMIDAVGRSEDKDSILQDLKDEQAFSRFFSKVSG